MKVLLSLPSALALLLAVFGAPTSAEPAGPPLEDGWYVRLGACPFEGCVYRDWTVERDTVLYSQERGNTQIGMARKGDTVQAITGNLYVVPVPVDVTHDHVDRDGLRLESGQRFHLLDYVGEGYHHVWLDGKEHQFRALYMYVKEDYRTDVSRFQTCEAPSALCWWKIAPEHRRQLTEWWVQIVLPDGTVGWTSEPEENFGNMDEYG